VKKSGVRLAETCAVFGAGAIGLLVIPLRSQILNNSPMESH
jgi:threonine dehydrogenase-like Zn-dependent dehydrogenase